MEHTVTIRPFVAQSPKQLRPVRDIGRSWTKFTEMPTPDGAGSRVTDSSAPGTSQGQMVGPYAEDMGRYDGLMTGNDAVMRQHGRSYLDEWAVNASSD